MTNTKKFTKTEKRLYYPSTFNLSSIPAKRGNHLDKYLYFLHTIYMGRIKDRRVTKQDYIPIHSETAVSILNSKMYMKIKKYWIAQGVIEENKSYKVGEYSKGYRFTSAYQNVKMKAAHYTCETFREKVAELQRELLIDSSTFVMDFLATNLDRLRIDSTAAYQYIADGWYFGHLDTDLYENYHQYITSIATGDLRQARDNKGNRVHNNFCNFPSELRFTLTNWYGEQLWNADLKNSQPLILGVLLKENGVVAGDAIQYIRDTESGNLYEKVAEAMGVEITDRKIFKQTFFGKVLFGENKYVIDSDEWKTFKNLYPSVAKFIYNYKDDYGYVALPLALQQIESKIVIDGVLATLAKKYGTECFALSIHDSITTTEEYYEEVVELMMWEFAKYDIIPTIKKEIF